ncbi:hypothetical protein MLD38_000352 [Melastoma candidum]|uniref:Uncharacterized protein n=1 Tax=Melastoma candidum TaxID=119954 RepID=A0ACB9S9V7_9MYRT|nr:hypothetical protein MLD38_000352 [Melastoma candidum]
MADKRRPRSGWPTHHRLRGRLVFLGYRERFYGKKGMVRLRCPGSSEDEVDGSYLKHGVWWLVSRFRIWRIRGRTVGGDAGPPGMPSGVLRCVGCRRVADKGVFLVARCATVCGERMVPFTLARRQELGVEEAEPERGLP